MDFFKLSRKQLQALCKKNKIPANVTNLAMAEALTAHHQVEGLDEILNSVEVDVGSPDVHRTAPRTLTRRKDVNVPATPAMPSSRRRAPSVSTRRKKEAQMPEDEKNGGDQGKPTDVPITPAAPTTRTRAYNTRRSVRLLEKNLSRMNLLDSEDTELMKVDDVSEDVSNVSQQTEISAENEKDKTGELEVTSQEKNTGYELGSGSENAVGVSLPAEPEDSNLKLEESSETCIDSNEVCDKTTEKAVHEDNEAEAELVFDFEDSISDDHTEDASTEVSEGASVAVTNHDVAAFSLPVEKPDDVSMEVTGQDNLDLLPMSSVSKTGNQGANDSAEITAMSNEVSEDASTEVVDQDVAILTVEVPIDASVEDTDQDIAGSLPMSSVSKTDHQGGDDSAEIYALSNEVSEDVCTEVFDQDVASLTVAVPVDASVKTTDQDIAGSLPMSPVSNDSVIIEGLVVYHTDKNDDNDSTEISDLSVESEDSSVEATDEDVPAFSVDVTALSIEIPEDASKEASDNDISGKFSVSSVCDDDSVNLKELLVCKNASQGGSDSAEISDSLISSLSCHANTLVDGDVIPEEIAIPKQESSISVETVTVAPIHEQLKGESHCLEQSGPKDVAGERIQEDKVYVVKENTSTYESMSMRELKKKLKNLKLDGKSNGKSNNVAAKEVDGKRTALQALPENRITAAVTKNDD